eukprot:gnl/Carplike_NY0171/6939_a9569_208.p1 GENE.gnl/Carplike_NY0171/6939_a9569_208~~gnl/Carplike_NY0171/6939_a9569_208.p1  ORF type:complete len:610 (-),score=110.18 gnl/Carplike_NY0171/6939_a9569_208:11-1582(-)
MYSDRFLCSVGEGVHSLNSRCYCPCDYRLLWFIAAIASSVAIIFFSFVQNISVFAELENRSMVPLHRYRDVVITAEALNSMVGAWMATLDAELTYQDNCFSPNCPSEIEMNNMITRMFESVVVPSKLVNQLSSDLVDILHTSLSWSNISYAFLDTVSNYSLKDISGSDVKVNLFPHSNFFSQSILIASLNLCDLNVDSEGDYTLASCNLITENILNYSSSNDLIDYSLITKDSIRSVFSDMYDIMTVQSTAFQDIIFFSSLKQFGLLSNSNQTDLLALMCSITIFTGFFIIMRSICMISSGISQLTEKITSSIWYVMKAQYNFLISIHQTGKGDPSMQKSAFLQPIDANNSHMQSILAPSENETNVHKTNCTRGPSEVVAEKEKKYDMVRSVYFPEESRLIQQQCIKIDMFPSSITSRTLTHRSSSLLPHIDHEQFDDYSSVSANVSASVITGGARHKNKTDGQKGGISSISNSVPISSSSIHIEANHKEKEKEKEKREKKRKRKKRKKKKKKKEKEKEKEAR